MHFGQEGKDLGHYSRPSFCKIDRQRLPVPRWEQRGDIPHAERCAVGVQPWVCGNIPSRCMATLPLLPAFLSPGLPVLTAEGLLRSPEI